MGKSNYIMKCPDSFDDSVTKKHLFKFRLNKIPIVLFTRLVANHDYDRLQACMSQKTRSPTGKWDNKKLFVLFDSVGYRCALNTSCISFAQFLFNPLYAPATDECNSTQRIYVFPADGSPTMTFQAKTWPINQDESGDEVNELQRIFYDLDFLERYIDGVRTVYFTDADGEIIYLNADDIALLEVPLHYVENTWHLRKAGTFSH